MSNHQTVSFDNEPLILVNDQDQVLGYADKFNAHAGEGILHRAFSIFLFTDTGKVLLQRRSDEKPLWPGYWSTSCCSHPRAGEDYLEAAHRRLREELAIDTALTFLYRFKYHARFDGAGSERELCSVYVGRLGQEVSIDVNPKEIADWRWATCAEVERMIEEESDQLTPWFLLEWQCLRDQHAQLFDVQVVVEKEVPPPIA